LPLELVASEARLMTARLFADAGLQDEVVLVTGGSRGIGRAIVELFAAEGADVTFFFRENSTAADAVVEAARARGQHVTAAQVDVRDRTATAGAVAHLTERTGRIGVLVNNSGVIRDNLLPLLEEEDVREVIDTNITGVFNVAHAVLPHMIAARRGAIVNISSVAAEKGGRGQTNYAASKGALNALTRSLAVELAPRRIRVNAVAPGVIETDLSAAVRERAPEELTRRVLLRRCGTAAEVAAVVVFLASAHASYITGQVVGVDGGFKME
jgi:3-oxoacyl-[acyl-carrier protein] reductase